jgi:hypothetical protein
MIIGGSRVAEAHAEIDYAAGKGPRHKRDRLSRANLSQDLLRP